MLKWEGLKREIKKVKGFTSEAVIKEVLPHTLEKIDEQLQILTDKMNELSK